MSLPWNYNSSIPPVLPPRTAPANPIELAAIMRAVVQVCDVTANELKSARRDMPLTRWRQMAVALACRLTDKTTTEIGRRFGGRDHTTVLHAVRKMQPYIAAVAAELDADASPMDWAKAMRRRLEGT